MKKLLILVVIFSLFTTPFSVMAKEKQEIKPLPEYSLEGVSPKVYYYEWDAKYRDWYRLVDPSNAKGPVMKVEKFFVDRNKDGVVDLKIIKYYLPDGNYKNDLNEIGVQKAHQWMVVYVDDNLDKLWDRMLYDKIDASGKLGMDGVFEQEEEVRY